MSFRGSTRLLVEKIFPDDFPDIVHVFQLPQILGEKFERDVLSVTVEVFDGDAIVDLDHVAAHLVIHDNNILEVSPAQQQAQVFNQFLALCHMNALFTMKQPIEVLLLFVHDHRDFLSVLLDGRSEDDELEVLAEFFEHLEQIWPENHR